MISTSRMAPSVICCGTSVASVPPRRRMSSPPGWPSCSGPWACRPRTARRISSSSWGSPAPGGVRWPSCTPDVIKARTFATLRQVHVRSSQQQPLLLIVENLHWLDPTSEAYLASLVEHLAGSPAPPGHDLSPRVPPALAGQVVCHAAHPPTPDAGGESDPGGRPVAARPAGGGPGVADPHAGAGESVVSGRADPGRPGARGLGA